MDASNPLIENITCSVCFEIYREPQALLCLHTYCKECIDKLKLAGGVSCPECRVYSHKNDIRPDFKTQSLIDFYKKPNKVGAMFFRQDSEMLRIPESASSLGLVNCDMCSSSRSRPAIRKCVTCNQLMCRVCSITHGNITTCKSHRVEDVTIPNNSVHVKIQQGIDKLSSEKKDIMRNVNKTDEAIKRVKKQQTEQEEEINRLTDDFIQNAERNRERLQRLVFQANDQCTSQLQANKTLLESGCREIQDKIEHLQFTPATEDDESLQSLAKGMDERVTDEINNIRAKLPEVNVESLLKSPVSVQQGVKLDLRNMIEIKVGFVAAEPSTPATDNHGNQRSGNVATTSSSSVATTPPSSNIVKVDLDYKPHRLYMVNNQLWCVALNAIYIYATDCTLIRQISDSKLRFIKGLTKTDHGDIIAACSNKRGVIQLDSSCSHTQYIAQGSFADVQYYPPANQVYVLEIDQSKVVIFDYIDEQWIPRREFSLNHYNIHARDRLSVQNNRVYISSCNNNCLYVYSLDGDLQYQTGETGRGSAGQLSGPLLCNVDSAGNALVADYSNHRLQVCEGGSQWCIVILPGTVNSPMDAVADDTADNTWIVTNQPEQLLKFTM